MASGLSRFLFGEERDEKSERIAEALRRWKAARAFFESADDPELIDFAVYDMEAARRRYVFLLRKYQE